MEEEGKIKILYVGFGVWEDNYLNISEKLIEQLKIDNPDVAPTMLTLETNFDSSTAALTNKIKDLKPDYIILLGESTESLTPGMQYELTARNFRNGNDEKEPYVRVIEEGQIYLYSKDYSFFKDGINLPPELTITSSTESGYFVCNSSFYVSLYEMMNQGKDERAFFIHINDAPGDVSNEVELRENFIQTYSSVLNSFTDKIVQHEQARRLGAELKQGMEQPIQQDGSTKDSPQPTEKAAEPTKSNGGNSPRR